jgi:hypothetical protein
LALNHSINQSLCTVDNNNSFFLYLLQNELDQVTTQLEQSDIKLLQIGAKNSALEAQLAEANVSF